MDCERFDRILPILELRQLDGLTRAAAERHLHQCQRCDKARGIFRRTIEFTAPSPLALPADLATEIVAGEREIQRALPTTKRIARGMTILAGYAMRPQIAMAALMTLMIGTSLVLLRPKPGSHSSVRVTETGLPVLDKEAVVIPLSKPDPELRPSVDDPGQAEPALSDRTQADLSPPTTASNPVSGARPAPVREALTTEGQDPLLEQKRLLEQAADRAYSAAMAAFQRGEHEIAKVRFEEIMAKGGKNAAAAELYAALATEQSAGCATAIPRFDSVSANYGRRHIGHTATWHSANCRVALGHIARAVHDFQKLLQARAYRKQAAAALRRLARTGKVKN